MAATLTINQKGKNPLVGIIVGEIKVDSSTPIDVNIKQPNPVEVRGTENGRKCRIVNDYRNFLQGDEIEIYFPLYEDSTDAPYSGGTPGAGYVMSGIAENIEVVVMLDNTTNNNFYDVDVELYVWSDKNGEYRKIDKGRIMLMYKVTSNQGGAFINGVPGVKIIICHLHVYADDTVNHKPYLRIVNNGTSVDVDTIIRYGVNHLEEVFA